MITFENLKNKIKSAAPALTYNADATCVDDD